MPHRKGDRKRAKKTRCTRCGKSAGAQAPPTVTTRVRVMWDNSHLIEGICSRCGMRTTRREPTAYPQLHRRKWKEYGHHLSGVYGGGDRLLQDHTYTNLPHGRGPRP
jgi:hypothetical protein